jgi:hypothetical protein
MASEVGETLYLRLDDAFKATNYDPQSVMFMSDNSNQGGCKAHRGVLQKNGCLRQYYCYNNLHKGKCDYGSMFLPITG